MTEASDMEWMIGRTHGGDFQLEAVTIAQGEQIVEVVRDEYAVGYFLIFGSIVAARHVQPAPRRQLSARPWAPMFLITPGRYYLTGERHSAGFRCVRRAACPKNCRRS